MEHFEYAWQSTDGTSFYGQGWTPEKPKAVICLVHGLGEHSTRYAHVGKVMSDAGFALLSFDLRGHGKSGGPRGHSPSHEAFLQDIDHLLEEAKERYAELPCFLYGHSMGGVLVLSYGLRRSPKINGVIATAASLRTAIEEQKGKVFIAKMLGSLLPSAVLPSGLEPNTISRDPEVVKRYIDDPLVHNKLSFGVGKGMLKEIPWAFKHASEFPVPLLIMHGTEDKLGYPTGSKEFASKVTGDCTLKLWEGLSHELHNEPEKDTVFNFTIGWIQSHL